jgi:dihydrofolate reductase
VFSKEEVRDGRPIRRDQPDEKGTATMKLTTTTFVSLDGVMQGISRRDEDRGGWTTPLWDNEARTYVNEVYQRADAFLFGRRTYEIFAGSWEQWQIRASTPSRKR